MTTTATEERPDIAGFDPDAGDEPGSQPAADPDPQPEPDKPKSGANAGTYIVLFVPKGEKGYVVLAHPDPDHDGEGDPPIVPRRFEGTRRQVMEAAYYGPLTEAEVAYPGMLLSPVPAGSWKPKPVGPASGLKIG